MKLLVFVVFVTNLVNSVRIMSNFTNIYKKDDHGTGNSQGQIYMGLDLAPLILRTERETVTIKRRNKPDKRVRKTYSYYSHEDLWRLPREYEVCVFKKEYAWRDRCNRVTCSSSFITRELKISSHFTSLCHYGVEWKDPYGEVVCEATLSDFVDECPGYFAVMRESNSGMIAEGKGALCPRKYWKCSQK